MFITFGQINRLSLLMLQLQIYKLEMVVTIKKSDYYPKGISFKGLEYMKKIWALSKKAQTENLTYCILGFGKMAKIMSYCRDYQSYPRYSFDESLKWC